MRILIKKNKKIGVKYLFDFGWLLEKMIMLCFCIVELGYGSFWLCMLGKLDW